MLSIEDLESACNASQRFETPRHLVEPPELPFHATFYPFGFPAVITTNSGGVLKQYEELWGKFTKQHDTEPIRAEVQVVESNATECPPEPTYRYMQPLLMCVADADNYSVGRFGMLPDEDRDFARRAAASALRAVFPPGNGRLLHCDPVYNAGACRMCCPGWTRRTVVRRFRSGQIDAIVCLRPRRMDLCKRRRKLSAERRNQAASDGRLP